MRPVAGIDADDLVVLRPSRRRRRRGRRPARASPRPRRARPPAACPTTRSAPAVATRIAAVDVSAAVSPPARSSRPPGRPAPAASCSGAASRPAGRSTTFRTAGSRAPAAKHGGFACVVGRRRAVVDGLRLREGASAHAAAPPTAATSANPSTARRDAVPARVAGHASADPARDAGPAAGRYPQAVTSSAVVVVLAPPSAPRREREAASRPPRPARRRRRRPTTSCLQRASREASGRDRPARGPAA